MRMKTRQNAVYSSTDLVGRPIIFADRSWPDLEYSSTNLCRFLVLICNSRESFQAGFHRRGTPLPTLGVFSHSAFAPRYAELRRFAAKNFHAVENDREKHFGKLRR
jgi:hypothetical protein